MRPRLIASENYEPEDSGAGVWRRFNEAEASAGLLPSSLTFHLQNLQRAGLIAQRRESRQLIYSADFAVMNGLVGYLTENCCGNSGSQCCPPALAVKPAKRAAKVA
jgi:ArsR family transcriptional regulator, arsenate/arsenite/antimonite-responsive transcriptional repressor